MAIFARSARALLWSVSFVSIGAGGVTNGRAEPTEKQMAVGQSTPSSQQPTNPQTRKKGSAEITSAVRNAQAQAVDPRSPQSLDTITVTASKTEERAIEALAPVSIVTLQQIQEQQPKRISDLFYNVPGVWFQDRGDDPSTSINIRGLQDFGRVAVVVDGARQNYQRTGHNANGSFFLDPELIGGIDIVRGPAANIYGSGAIGGVASFRTKDIEDVVRTGERWGVDLSGTVGSNQLSGVGSIFGGIHATPNVDVFGGAVYRNQSNYKDGDGTEIGNTANEATSGLIKTTIRPAEGHEVKLGVVYQGDNYTIGQLNRGATTTAALRALNQGSSVYDSHVKNTMATLGWKYSRPDDDLFDWDAKLYGNQTINDQTKTYHYSTSGAALCGPGSAGNNISGCVGDPRGYTLNTFGFDVHNTTRFGFAGLRNALTYGGDLFRDDVSTSDTRGNSNITTPGGVRTVSGAFVQLKSNYSTWLEVVSAVRYDHYELSSASTKSEGDRFSPKVSVGITPFSGFQPYISYAEGYRAPSITETLIAGAHATGGGPAFFVCPDGTTGLFCFLPNPNLRPEVGKNKEVGINLKYDGVFSATDSFRGKINVFRNDIDNYIDLVASAPTPVPPFGSFSEFYQYQNIPAAKIEGFEAELAYDAGDWFAGVTATLQRGKNTATNVGLASIAPQKITTTGGVRFLDRKLVIGGQWAAVTGNDNIPTGYVPSTSYNLINLYATYQATRDIVFNLTVDNLLDQYYRPYAIPGSSTDGTTQNDVLWTSPGPGLTVKGGVRIHFGGA
ncbi:MAG: TonB-dependent hemoglobin/transferrin/lactoferrin family receptor [Xanthobacteraceae bacterium]|nr:TonB-dependent hemoglobin/transferrin/lactoferrin family receptor [Xanthobacteraceae bacterium]